MKGDFTAQELEMRSAEDRLHSDSPSAFHPLSGNPALHTIMDNIRKGHLSLATAAVILLLMIGALAFCVYFVRRRC